VQSHTTAALLPPKIIELLTAGFCDAPHLGGAVLQLSFYRIRLFLEEISRESRTLKIGDQAFGNAAGYRDIYGRWSDQMVYAFFLGILAAVMSSLIVVGCLVWRVCVAAVPEKKSGDSRRSAKAMADLSRRIEGRLWCD